MRQKSRAGCQPLPASLLSPGTQLPGRSDLMPVTQFSSHSSPLCQLIPSRVLVSVLGCRCPLPSVPAVRRCTAALPRLHTLTFLTSSSSLSSLLPPDLFSWSVSPWGAAASSSPSLFGRCWPQPFHRLSLPLLLSNKSLPSAFSPVLFPLNAVSVRVPSSFAVCPEAETKSALSVLPHSSPFHLLTTALLPLGFVPLNLSCFLRLI